MKNRIILLVVILVAALRAEGAMVRLAGIENGKTLIVEREGKRERVVLAGVAILDDAHARTMLEWTIGTSWLSVEQTPDGVFLYRSPDALFLNRELVARGFARATLPELEPRSHVAVTYLGTLELPEAREAKPQVRNAPASRNGSATRRRPPASPSPRRRPRR
jgi:hypothetical protein